MIEIEIIEKILPKSFSGIFFCIIATLEIINKGIPIPWQNDRTYIWVIFSIR